MLCSKKWSLALGITAALVALPVANSAGKPPIAKPSVTVTVKKPVVTLTEMDLVETAVSAGSFKTLTTALKAAGLVETLKGKGPFTVLAPTDAAFAKLPAGTLDSLLKPENKGKLAAILKYHVIPGNLMAADAAKLKSAKTVNGATVNIKSEGDTVMMNDAKVITADIACTNGVIHVIDTVLMPKE